ncbi:uncharacterized protein LOC100897330 [Galendromus occidentalis]|uniref:Uncharacterized protein LOC100897330 n=1 Tax=Galendromus occidentalis TaxID=34638 RepID=A0AAJ6QQ15_9ACAR|nr:uncharacterized protein LOC100897330 [Galendromus occidentalis]
MEDAELARIRAERMAQLQTANARDGGEDTSREEQAEEYRNRAEQMKNQALQQILTQEARARLAMIEMTKPELAELAIQSVLRMTGGGRSAVKISDEDLRGILERLSSSTQKKETKVTFNRRRAGLDSDDEDW